MERRKQKRKCETGFSFYSLEGKGVREEIMNICGNGLSFSSEIVYRKGETISVELTGPSGKSSRIPVLIKWRSPSDSKMVYGGRFLKNTDSKSFY
ncbi:MAG: PilZ domain-containing protein [Fibrobacterota bacterium]